MIGKKDNKDIFKQYTRVLLEQAEDNAITSLMNRIKTSQLDGQTKSEILNLLEDKTVQDVYKMMKLRKDSGFVDQDTANEQDPNFADEMRKAGEEQRSQNPEQKPPSMRVTI
jgi:hypothetical protein